MGSSICWEDEKPRQNIMYNNIINNGVISYNSQNNYPIQNIRPVTFQGGRAKASNCCCPLCGEEFLKGRFFNSGEDTDYFNCRQCGQYQNQKYYFKCGNCRSKFCTTCPKKSNYIPDFSCPLCGEEFARGKGNLVNSGEDTDYFNCRKCGQYQNQKHYFKCKNCKSKFCTRCPENNTIVPNCSCPLCGEQFSRGRGNLVNSGEDTDYFNCRKCGQYQNQKHYFKCRNCGSKFCTKCPENNYRIPNYGCPICGEQFFEGRGNFVNSGEDTDYFNCRQCGQYQNQKHYFKCRNCGGKFCTRCPMQ